MKFLITGATGFIGKNVVAECRRRGHDIILLTRHPHEAQSLFGKDIACLALDDFLSRPADFSFPHVIHLAWANVQNYADAKNMDDNLVQQQTIIKALVTAGAEDITVTGTCLEYGLSEGECSEDTFPPLPLLTPYAEAKTKLYHSIIEAFPHIALKWVRCFYLYGDGQRPNALLPILLTAIERGDTEFNLPPDDPRRDFIHVKTLAHNIVTCAEQNTVTGIINGGNGVGHSLIDFVEKVAQIKNHKMTFHRGRYPQPSHEPFAFWAKPDKLLSIAGTKIDKNIWL